MFREGRLTCGLATVQKVKRDFAILQPPDGGAGDNIYVPREAPTLPDDHAIDLKDILNIGDSLYYECRPRINEIEGCRLQAEVVCLTEFGIGQVEELRWNEGYLLDDKVGRVHFSVDAIDDSLGGVSDLTLSLRVGDQLSFEAVDQQNLSKSSRMTHPPPSAKSRFEAVRVTIPTAETGDPSAPYVGFVARKYQDGLDLYARPFQRVFIPNNRLPPGRELNIGDRVSFKDAKLLDGRIRGVKWTAVSPARAHSALLKSRPLFASFRPDSKDKKSPAKQEKYDSTDIDLETQTDQEMCEVPLVNELLNDQEILQLLCVKHPDIIHQLFT